MWLLDKLRRKKSDKAADSSEAPLEGNSIETRNATPAKTTKKDKFVDKPEWKPGHIVNVLAEGKENDPLEPCHHGMIDEVGEKIGIVLNNCEYVTVSKDRVLPYDGIFMLLA